VVRVFYSESDWLHCPRCGADTVDITKPDGHDPRTGRARVKHYRKCPNGRFWNSAKGGYQEMSGLHLAKTEINYLGPRPAPTPGQPAATR
jgi:hypothetical protein